MVISSALQIALDGKKVTRRAWKNKWIQSHTFCDGLRFTSFHCPSCKDGLTIGENISFWLLDDLISNDWEIIE